MVPDVIEREMVFRAPREKVWAAITEAEQIARWFSPRVKVDLRPGGRLEFGWPELNDDAEGIVEVVEPMTRFVFTWRPFNHLKDVTISPELRLRVEYVLSDHPWGTKLRMRESGFSKLPEGIAPRSFTSNEYGWTEELSELWMLLREPHSVTPVRPELAEESHR
jgi:uncharacterized protein YndB with AHSA1/START domain